MLQHILHISSLRNNSREIVCTSAEREEMIKMEEGMRERKERRELVRKWVGKSILFLARIYKTFQVILPLSRFSAQHIQIFGIPSCVKFPSLFNSDNKTTISVLSVCNLFSQCSKRRNIQFWSDSKFYEQLYFIY